MSSVSVTRFVNCPFSAVIDFAEETLRSRPDITLSPVPHVGQRVNVTAQVTDDTSDTSRLHDALLIAWQPKLRALFPNFHGALTVRPKDRGAWLRIQGSYDPPLGIPGRIFDAVAGRFIARRTLARTLKEVCEAVEWRWRAFRSEVPV